MQFRAAVAVISFVIIGSCGKDAEKEPVISVSDVAWSSEDAAELKKFELLRTETPKSGLGTETAVRALLSNIPDVMTFAIDSFEPEGKGVVANGVRFSLAEDPSFGVEIGELRVYGLSDDINEKLSAGGQIHLADRLDIREISLFGVESFIDTITAAYTEGLEGVIEDMTDMDSVDSSQLKMEYTSDNFQLFVDQWLIDDLKWTTPSAEVIAVKNSLPALTADATGEDAVWSIITGFARFSHSLSYDTSVAYDMSVSATANLESDMISSVAETKFSIPLSASRDYALGDSGPSYTQGMSYSYDLTMPSGADGQTDKIIQMSSTIDLAVGSGAKLAKLVGFLERKEVPSTEVTDLISLGRFTSYGQVLSINDKPLYSVGKSDFDLSEFHWFIPEKIKYSAQDVKYDLASYMDFISDMVSAEVTTIENSDSGQEFDVEKMTETLSKVKSVLAENDADVLDMELDFSIEWDAETGAASVKSYQQADGFGENKLLVGMKTPLFSEMAPLIDQQLATAMSDEETEPEDETAFEDLWASRFALSEVDFTVDDAGGLDKIFGMVTGFAKLVPEGDPSVAMIRGYSPTELRNMISGLTRVGSMQASQVFPPAVGYINGIADFIRDGGSISFRMKPEQPIGRDNLPQVQMMLQAPEKLETYLGLEFQHSKKSTSKSEKADNK